MTAACQTQERSKLLLTHTRSGRAIIVSLVNFRCIMEPVCKTGDKTRLLEEEAGAITERGKYLGTTAITMRVAIDA